VAIFFASIYSDMIISIPVN